MMVQSCEIKAEAPTAKVRRNKNDKLWIVPEVLPPGFLHPKKQKKRRDIWLLGADALSLPPESKNERPCVCSRARIFLTN